MPIRVRLDYNFERFFVKNPSNSLKTFTHFATLLQNDRGRRGAALLLMV